MLAGRRFVLIVDEAQDLERPVLETIRLLSDFETPHCKNCWKRHRGQPQLRKNCTARSVTIAAAHRHLSHLEPLSVVEIACYIEYRSRWLGIHVARSSHRMPWR